jgi:hypothetical protein
LTGQGWWVTGVMTYSQGIDFSTKLAPRPGYSPLARIVHDQGIMRAILITYWDKPVHAQKQRESWFQILPGVELEYVIVYRGLGGLAPKIAGFGE